MLCCDVYHSCHVGKYEFKCKFVDNKRLRFLVSRFTPVNERIATNHIRAKFYISFICTHTSTEEKDAKLKDAYDKSLDQNAKIVLGDFNAK